MGKRYSTFEEKVEWLRKNPLEWERRDGDNDQEFIRGVFITMCIRGLYSPMTNWFDVRKGLERAIETAKEEGICQEK